MSEVDDWQNTCKDNKSRAEYILHNEILTDCKFLIGQESDEVVTIRGHKLIMGMASPVFQRMFYGNFDDGELNEVRISDVKHNIFHKMMDYIYFEKLELVTVENALELYSAANKYMLHNLIRECRIFLKRHRNISNVWKIYEFSEFFEDNDLINSFSHWMARNAFAVFGDAGFLDAKLTSLIALLKRDNLNICSELHLFVALDKYALANGYFDTKNSAENREESEIEKRVLLMEALKLIRFLCLTPEHFVIVAKSKLLTESEVLSILLHNVSSGNYALDRPMPEGFSNSRTPRQTRF